MMTTIKINGKDVPVDAAFNDLTPEQQEMEKKYIAEQMAKGITFGGGEPVAEKEPTTIAGLPISAAPQAGAVMGATMGAAVGPAVGEVMDKGIATGANMLRPMPGNASPNAPQSVRNWLATQTSTPYAGGRDYEEAARKANIAGSKPVQSRGSTQGIRRGGLGINVQPEPPTLPQKAAANILNAERMPKPGITRRVAGMGVAGAELGNMAKEFDEGNYGRAALSGVGAAGGAMSQSRIKPVRALGTGLSVAVPAIQKFLLKDKDEDQSNIQEKAMGGSVAPSPKLKSLSDFLDQLMQQSTAPAPAPAPAAPQGGMPPGMPPQGGMPPGMPGVPPQQPPMQQPPTQQSPLNAMMPQMAKGGKVGALGSVAKKLSEVLVPREGQTIIGTMADRTKATEGFSGGPGFINLHPEYTWAMDAPGAASRLLNVVNAAGGPERTVIAPMLMSKTAHKSNRPVFEKIYKELQEDIRSGKVTPEQVEALNKRLAIEKGLEASPGIDSKDFLEFANAFHRRGSVANILGQKRIGAVDLQRHLDETIDPALREAELGAIGPQLFTAESQLLKPDVHPGYKYVLTGEKGADQFTPVPREFLFRDLEYKAMKELGRPLSDYNYRTSVGVPSQLIDEKLIRSLEELGYKKGGLV